MNDKFTEPLQIRKIKRIGFSETLKYFAVLLYEELVNSPSEIDIDFGAVMERMRKIRAEISENDSAERFRNLGVDVFLGSGKFVGENAIAVNDQQLRFKKAVIATGARATNPQIAGLAEAGYLTNETVFSLSDRRIRMLCTAILY